MVILVSACVLRVCGIWYGLPSVYNSDEPFNVVNALAYGAKQSLEPTYHVYPALYSYVLLGVYGLYYGAGLLAGNFSGPIDFGSTYFIDASGFYLTGRFLSAVVGVATVWLVFVIGRRFFSRQTGYCAAALLTFSYAHTDLSHWILPEALLALLCSWALFQILRFHDQPSWQAGAMAGILAGLAISTKYNAGFLILPLILTSCFSAMRPTAILRSVCLNLVAVACGFFAGSPYWLLSFASYWADLKYTLGHVSSGMVGHIAALPGVWPLWELVFNDWTVGLLLVSGVFFALFGRDRKSVLLLAFIVPTLLYLGFWNRSGIHYLTPIYPALAVLGGLFLHKVLLRVQNPIVQKVAILLFFLPVFLKIGWQDFRLTREDSRTAAKNWIENNLKTGSLIAYENYVYGPNLFDPSRFTKNTEESNLLPTAMKEELLAESLRRPSYRLVNLRKDFRLKALDRMRAENSNLYLKQLLESRLPRLSSVAQSEVPYLIASSDNYRRYFEGQLPDKSSPLWYSYSNGRAFYESVLHGDRLQLLQEFSPGAWNLGPKISIYKSKAAGGEEN